MVTTYFPARCLGLLAFSLSLALFCCHYGELPWRLLFMPDFMTTVFFFLHLVALLFLGPHPPLQHLLPGSSLWGPWLGAEVQPSLSLLSTRDNSLYHIYTGDSSVFITMPGPDCSYISGHRHQHLNTQVTRSVLNSTHVKVRGQRLTVTFSPSAMWVPS